MTRRRFSYGAQQLTMGASINVTELVPASPGFVVFFLDDAQCPQTPTHAHACEHEEKYDHRRANMLYMTNAVPAIPFFKAESFS